MCVRLLLSPTVVVLDQFLSHDGHHQPVCRIEARREVGEIDVHSVFGGRHVAVDGSEHFQVKLPHGACFHIHSILFELDRLVPRAVAVETSTVAL